MKTSFDRNVRAEVVSIGQAGSLPIRDTAMSFSCERPREATSKSVPDLKGNPSDNPWDYCTVEWQPK